MPNEQPKRTPASAREIREILGPVDDSVIASILAVGAAREEILEANAWLSSDDYLHRALHHGLSGRTALVFDILEAELPEPDRR